MKELNIDYKVVGSAVLMFHVILLLIRIATTN